MATNGKISALQLVYPPLSNQEAHWFETDPEVEKRFRQSDFYMIGGRPEIKFVDLVADQDARTLTFKVTCGAHLEDTVTLDLDVFVNAAKSSDIELEAGEKMIRFWEDGHEDLIDWFTTEKLLYDRWRKKPGIVGFDRFREFAEYDLLYVGIAKVGDTFDRLIAKGHKARMDILSNEPQRYPGARVTDEIYLFLFRVDPLLITTYEVVEDFDKDPFDIGAQHKRIVADAEKAFVSMLKPQYNITKFKNYPKGTDGLYGAGIDRYGYLIGENVTFNTPHGKIKGGYDPKLGYLSNTADFISVEGENVTLWVSGVDFPGSDPFFGWTGRRARRVAQAPLRARASPAASCLDTRLWEAQRRRHMRRTKTCRGHGYANGCCTSEAAVALESGQGPLRVVPGRPAFLGCADPLQRSSSRRAKHSRMQ